MVDQNRLARYLALFYLLIAYLFDRLLETVIAFKLDVPKY